MAKILLIGSGGQVGQELQYTLAGTGELIGVGREELDLTDGEAIRALIAAVHPDYIVNAGAYTAVDRAESDAETAYAVNGEAVKIMATAGEKIGATLVHISTDYVFDGTKNTPYLETDATNPIGVYGKSKLAGEEYIREISSKYIILRTAWVYGVYGKGNFVKTMLRLGKEREEIRVVVDQIGCPTWAYDIARTIELLIKNPETPTGIYHFTNSGVASWFDFARAIFDGTEAIGIPLKVKRVIPIPSAEYPTPATRPAYSVLSSRKITDHPGYVPPYWRDSLKLMLDRYLKTLR